jgi:hypothetical protein
MRIGFERTGGFAGLRMSASIDTNTLEDETAAELHQMVEQADFFNLPAKITGDASTADMYQYRITVETDDRQHTVYIENVQPPDALNTLIRRLTVVARSHNK